MVDFGVGIRASLSRIHPGMSGVESLRKVFAGGYSGRSLPRNMGQGLSNLAAVVANHQGELIVFSGDAVGIRTGVEADARFESTAVSFPGTAIFFKMKLLS